MSLSDWGHRVGQDVGYAWRGLRRTPGFTAAAVVVLALGLGANGALVSLLDQIFVRVPAGVDAPHEIRRFYYMRPQRDVHALAPANGVYEPAMYPEYVAIRDAVGSGAQLATYVRPDSVDIHAGAVDVPAMVSYVTRSYFSVLRIAPALGRFFTGDEDRVDVVNRTAIISDALWHRAFNAERGALGAKLRIGGRDYTIVGIGPPRFTGIDMDRADVWLPLGALPTPPFFSRPWYRGGFGVFRVVARLPSTITDRKLSSVATVAYRRARQDEGVRDTTSTVITGPIVAALGPADRKKEISVSLRLAGVSLMLLLIACGNVANLLLVRATHRRREIAVRRALGVSQARLCWQLIVESLLLSTLGAAAALLIGAWGVTALRGLLMPEIHWAADAGDFRRIAFTAAVSVLTGIVAGLVPAFHAGTLDVSDALKAGARSAARRHAWTRTGLMVGQAALSVVLLVGAGLFVRSLRNVHGIDLGFESRGLVVVTARFRNFDRRGEIGPALESVAAEMTSVPGVQRTALASVAPLQGAYSMSLFLPGRDSLPTVDGTNPFTIRVSPEYFGAARVHLVAGRTFASTDGAVAAPVAIVGRGMARLFWPDENPLGKCVQLISRTAPCTTVVGVVEDTHMLGVIEPRHFMQLYLPLAQHAELDADPFSPWGNRVLLVRTQPVWEAVVTRFAQRAVHERLPDLDVLRVEGMSKVLGPELRPWRLGATLFGVMGVLAVLVASVGVYSVIAYTVSQRTNEMGVRLALGARARDILALVAGESLRVVLVGIAIGIAAAFALGRLVESLLYGVSSRDPLVLVGACVLLALIGLGASLVPALRAARIDPARSLRAD